MELPATIVLAWFDRADYAEHVRLDPNGMKPRFEDWLRDAERVERELKADGRVVARVLLDPQKLAAWAMLHGTKINAETRARFAHDTFINRHRH